MAQDKKQTYEEFYKNYLLEQQQIHAANQKKIRVGLKVNIFLPLVFLVLSFLTHSSKLIFLILWIVSLFGIAFYLMYVEYTDHLMQKRLASMAESVAEDALIGEALAEAGDRASARISQRAEQMEAMVKEKLPKQVEEQKVAKQVAGRWKAFTMACANIFRVFWNDAIHLSRNVVAMVVIIGLSVIPCLYAWFNILSNWAPYEAEATGNLMVAVASEDTGVQLEGKELNVGTKIVDNLKANNSIHWVFLDTEEAAIAGVNAGDYYAALVVSETFSQDLVSFIGGDVTHPSLAYYENAKKNAIAPKITGKVKTTVQKEVNEAFVATLAGSVLEAGQSITEGGDETLSSAALTKMKGLDTDLSTVLTILDSYISMLDTTDSLMQAANQVSDELDVLMNSAETVINSANATVSASRATVDTVSDLITLKMQQMDMTLVMLDRTIQSYADGAGDLGAQANAAIASVPTLSTDQVDTIVTEANAAIDADATLSDAEKTTKKELISNAADEVKSQMGTLNTDLETFRSAAEKTNTDADALYTTLSSDISSCRTQLQSLSNTYQNQVKPQLKNSISKVEHSILEVKELLNVSSDSISDIAAILGTYPDMMSLGRDHLVESRTAVSDMQGKLRDLISDMEGLNGNERYAMVMKLLQTDPELISDFISEPIALEQKPLYAIDTNGSATAPFYIVLSIWVGALILVAILKTEVKDCPVVGVKRYQEFFGRYLSFFAIGQLQTLITVLGALLYVNIQCKHPFLLWLAMAFTSMTYTFFLYALTYAFGAVGEAIAVVLMVLQVAGSGGTFPVEVLPMVYRVLYRFMPFNYSMNAARECIAGMYGTAYWTNLLALCAYIVLSVVIGLLISVPCKRLNEKIEASKAGSDLMA
ncbi:MAG: YhgE/Pip domain-containing protein [Lachnospiraceae bacterium]|nr:YhgE/Pip domain-containing protein [Lachnospiraceae bacterium]